MATTKNSVPTKEKRYKLVSNPRFQYEIHLGNRIKEVMREKKITFLALADYLKITKTGLANKLNKTYFGTTFELIAVCTFLETDFLSELTEILAKQGINPKDNRLSIATDNKNYQVKLQDLEAKIKRYETIIDKLSKS